MRTVTGSKLLPPFFHLWHLCLCNHSLSSETLGWQRCKCHVCPGIQSPNTLEPASPAQSSLRTNEYFGKLYSGFYVFISITDYFLPRFSMNIPPSVRSSRRLFDQLFE